MKSDINDLCEAFLAALTNAGYAVKSIETTNKSAIDSRSSAQKMAMILIQSTLVKYLLIMCLMRKQERLSDIGMSCMVVLCG